MNYEKLQYNYEKLQYKTETIAGWTAGDVDRLGVLTARSHRLRERCGLWLTPCAGPCLVSCHDLSSFPP